MKLAALVGVVLMGAVFSELLVLAVWGEQAKFPRHVVAAPWGLRYNEPGAVYRHSSPDIDIEFRINSQGMRADREFPKLKPAGVRRIISLGDSFTIGYEVEREQCFSSVLEQELSGRGIPVEVMNCGMSGSSNAEELLYLERELMSYQPDLVLLSFCSNDLEDNVRTGLFKLNGEGQLVEAAQSYVPGGAMGDFLNRNWLFSKLSERSNAFCFFKEKATTALKGKMVGAQGGPAKQDPTRDAKLDALAIAIFERLYAKLSAQGIPLVIQSIPLRLRNPEVLLDKFPAGFVTDRPGLAFLSTRSFLEPLIGKEQTYWERSMGHWTPLAHRLSGERLAELIASRGLLTPPSGK